VSRAVLALYGLGPADLQGSAALTPEATRALRTLLRARDFDLTRPLYVRELPEFQGFRLAQ
jgi:hypothetical protein